MNDLTKLLNELHKLRAQTASPPARAVLDQAIAHAEARACGEEWRAGVSIGQAGDVIIGAVVGRDLYQASIQIFFQAAGLSDPSEGQRRALRAYLDVLARSCDHLRLAGVVARERTGGPPPILALSQVYVTLAAAEWATLAEADTAEELAGREGAVDTDDALPQYVRRVVAQPEALGAIRVAFGERRPRYRLECPLLLTKALSTRRQIVLLGGPGSGKSAFLRHLAVTLARGEDIGTLLPGWSAEPLLPLYASLGSYAAWAQQDQRRLTTASLWEFLAASAEDNALADMRSQLGEAFHRRGLLLLLDGLDEVADAGRRAQVAAIIAELGIRQEGYIAVACRERAFDDAVAARLAEWGPPVRIAPLRLAQIEQYVRLRYDWSARQGALDTAMAGDLADDLAGQIRASADLRDLARTPLLLTTITILHAHEGRLPADRAELYEALVQLLLTRWATQRRAPDGPPGLVERLGVPGLREFHLRGVLEELAYRARRGERSADGRGLLEGAIIEAGFTRLFKNLGLARGEAYSAACEVLAYLVVESGLLLEEGGELFALPHRSYEEYLAGCYLAKQEQGFLSLAYEHWRQDTARWREVVTLALGRMLRTDKRETVLAWLEFLLLPNHGARVRDEAERHAGALFAADCLADLGGAGALSGVEAIHLGTSLSRLAGLLAEAAGSRHLSAAERLRAGHHLDGLDDPRPGVHELPPAMMPIAAGSAVLGVTPEEAPALRRRWLAYWRLRGQPTAELLADMLILAELNPTSAITVVAAFELARHPLTNAQYAVFIAAEGYNPAAPWWDEAGRAWLARDDRATEGLEADRRRVRKDQPAWWGDGRFGAARRSHPVVGVTWHEASAFCRWLGMRPGESDAYRLPDAAEWEYAARGPERRLFPWGDQEAEGERANFAELYDGTSAVGCFPQGQTPEGLLDMAGNVWEWTGSALRPAPDPAPDGAPEPTEQRYTLVGGGWINQAVSLRASNRLSHPPDYHSPFVGFRVTRQRRT